MYSQYVEIRGIGIFLEDSFSFGGGGGGGGGLLKLRSLIYPYVQVEMDYFEDSLGEVRSARSRYQLQLVKNLVLLGHQR